MGQSRHHNGNDACEMMQWTTLRAKAPAMVQQIDDADGVDRRGARNGQIVQPAHPLGQVQARCVRATAGPDVPDCVLAVVDPQPTTDALVVHDHAQGRRGDAVQEAVGGGDDQQRSHDYEQVRVRQVLGRLRVELPRSPRAPPTPCRR